MSGAPDLDPEEFRRLAHQAVELVVAHLDGMRKRPVYRPMTPTERERLMTGTLPDESESPETIMRRLEACVLPHPMGNGHPRFFGWVNSPPAPLGVIADLLAAALNPSCAGGDHAAIYVEHAAMRWLMELVGFPTSGSMGLLASGASAASLVAIAAARHRAAARHGWNVRDDGLQGVRPRLRLYVSEEGHSCLRKAAEILGLGSASVRTLPVDDAFRMHVGALEAAVRADREGGHLPFCVAASAGTVGTGAIDPLADIADVCEREGLWLHVDGAYGAIGVVDPALAPRYAGLDRADSLVLDPHKWLSVPVECGAVFVRDGRLLRDTFSLVPPYLRTEEGKGFGGAPWLSEYGFQQTRGFRALKLWMVLQHLGRRGIARQVTRHVALARRLAAAVDAAPELERLAPVELSIVCFRYVPASQRGDDAALDALNKRVMEHLQTDGEVFVTNTTVRGRFALRACVLHYATVEADIDALVAAVRRAGARLHAEGGRAPRSGAGTERPREG
jgi:aromatic-L-amino-acid/L-tryptophan decarboxylase